MPDHEDEPELTIEQELLLKTFPHKITREELLRDARKRQDDLDPIVLHLDPEDVRRLLEASEED